MKAKKYHLVERDMREYERACSISEMEISLQSTVPSVLPGDIQSVASPIPPPCFPM